jgi:hypothetical protein
VYAQKAKNTQVDSQRINMEEKLKRLEKTIQEVKYKIEEKEQSDELQKLLEEAEKLKSVEKKEEDSVGKKFHTGVRQQSGLNPNLSVSGDFFSAISSKKDDFITQPSDFSYGSNGFYLRELEVALIAPLDPFTRGKSFISITENTISIEEAYMSWLNLPLNMNLSIGLFNVEFGILNRYHDHALPQFDRPKVLSNFFTNGNFGGTGLTSNFLLPTLFGANASLLDLAIINGGSGISFTDQGDLNLVYVGNFTNFYDITESTFFEWRVGTITGFNDPEEKNMSVVGNLSFNLKWIPVARAKYRLIDWKTEFLYSHRNTPDGSVKSFGFYTSLQNKLNAQWWLSGRIDYSQIPYDNKQNEWAFTICTDFWQSDFVFLRWQYQYSKRNFKNIVNYNSPYPNDHSLVFQVNWAMGPHKHEAY